ncbi:MAG: hypothetical protein KA214_07335 [Neisseriaceae bacterium]|nr:hypothetical protein [Neisseriaceae bacterium]
MDPLHPSSFAHTPPEAQSAFVPDAQSRHAGVGADWISSAWRLFRGKTGMWIGLMILAIIGSMVVNAIARYVPFGEFIQFLLTPVLIGGLMLLCDHQYRTGEFDLGLVFRPFKTHLWPLLGLALIQVLYLVVLMVALYGLLGLFLGFEVLAAIISHDGMMNVTEYFASGGARMGFLILFVVGLLVAMLFYYALIWFSPSLIVLHDVPAFSAVKMSLMAVKKNLLPGLVFYLLLTLLSLVCLLFLMMTMMFMPLFLLLALILMVVLGPVMMITMYASYRSLFLREG